MEAVIKEQHAEVLLHDEADLLAESSEGECVSDGEVGGDIAQ